MTEIDYTQLGAIAIIFLFFIKEFFGFLRNKKNNKGNGEILKAVNAIRQNHLDSIKEKLDAHSESSDEKLNKIITLLEIIKSKMG